LTLLITGGSGTLGTELKKQFSWALTPTHEQLDITDRMSVERFLYEHSVDTIIHAAAITSIRKCDENRKMAYDTNYLATKVIVDLIQQIPQSKMVYISTACVFDGHHGMYSESDFPYPENYYGLTKLLAEHTVKRLWEYLIIRTNFVGRKKWPYPKAFTDRFGTYLFADQVAYAIKELLKDEKVGTIHVVGDRKISMFELAKITTPKIEPMTLDEYSGPRLTIDMSLDTERWKKYQITATI